MSQRTDESPVEADLRQSGLLDRCPRCSMQVRRTEIEIHLAHSHNIGPAGKSDKGKDRRTTRRGSSRD